MSPRAPRASVALRKEKVIKIVVASHLRLFHKGNYKYVKSLNLRFILCVLISKCMPYRNLRSAQQRHFKYHLNVLPLI